MEGSVGREQWECKTRKVHFCQRPRRRLIKGNKSHGGDVGLPVTSDTSGMEPRRRV